MNYVRDIMTVNVFDIIHKKEEDDFRYSKFEIKVRLYDDWKEILDKVSLSGEFYGSWHFDPYDKASSRRLIVLARKIN